MRNPTRFLERSAAAVVAAVAAAADPHFPIGSTLPAIAPPIPVAYTH